jgi:hypothetical protein
MLERTEQGWVERMNHSKGTSLWVWLTLGLIGLGLNAFAGLEISARIKDRPEVLELHGAISN